MSINELKRKIFGSEQTPLSPASPTPATDSGGSIVVEAQRRGKAVGLGVAALVVVVVITLLRGGSQPAPTAPLTTKAKDVHTSEATTPSALFDDLKKLPSGLGGPPDLSAGDKERARLEMEARERQKNDAIAAAHGQPQQPTSNTAAPPEDPIAQEKKKQQLEIEKRAWASYFANPVIQVGSEPDKTSREPVAGLTGPVEAAPSKDEEIRPRLTVNPREKSLGEDESRDCVDYAGEDNEPRYCIPEGFPISARLAVRAIGDLPGPVKGIVAYDVYSRDRQHKLIPAGTELIGNAHELGSTWQERLSMSFHRMLLPDGSSVGLEKGLGLDQYGSMGIKDKVNRHIPGKILTVVSLGALSALAAGGTSAGYNTGYTDVARQNMSQQAAQTGQQMIGKQLNRPNSLTIEEGKIYQLWLSQDIHVREWRGQ